MSKNNNPVLVFDLGNVVNEFIGFKEIQRLWMPDISTDDIKYRWITCTVVIAHEKGKINADEFAHEFVKEWQIPVSKDDFLKLFMSWILPPFDGVEDLLSQLQENHTLACLSNTSAPHWQRMGKDFGLEKYFTHQYLSFLMGMVKPDEEIFVAVQEELSVNGDNIIFFDDTSVNVSSARKLGIQAYQVEGIKALKNKCRELELIS